MIILFFMLWGLLFAAALLMTAAVPTTVRTSNADLVAPLLITAVIAGIVTLLVAGLLSLI